MPLIDDLRTGLQRLGNLERQRENLIENIIQEEEEIAKTISQMVVKVNDPDIVIYKKMLRILLEIWSVSGSPEEYEHTVRTKVSQFIAWYQNEAEDDE